MILKITMCKTATQIYVYNLFLPSQSISKRTKMVRDLISEVVGLSPYEKRLMDMLKTGGTSSEKRMYKFAKRRVRLCFDFEILFHDLYLLKHFMILNFVYCILCSWEHINEQWRREIKLRKHTARLEHVLPWLKCHYISDPCCLHWINLLI